MKFGIEIAANSLSIGQTSINIAQNLFKRGLAPSIFPIANNIDVSAFDNLTDDFKLWYQAGINKSLKHHQRKDPLFKNWHINGSFPSYSDKQTLFFYHELDAFTDEEINTLKNQYKILTPSKFTVGVLSNYGVECVYCPLGVDGDTFKRIEKRPYDDDRVVIGLSSKWEERKNHSKVLRAFARKWGNNPKYILHASLFNHFLTPDQQNGMINQALGGQRIWNINLIPFTQTNSAYNQVLNTFDVIVDMSGGESFSLPLAQCLKIGKHACVLNAHVFKTMYTEKEVSLVEPTGKKPMVDGVFFSGQGAFNVGNMFETTEDAIIDGIERAIERYRKEPVNKAGMELAATYTWGKTTDIILENLAKTV